MQLYDLDLAYDPTDFSIDARLELHALATQDLSSFNLDFYGLEVDSIQVGGKPAEFARDGHELIVKPVEAIRDGAPLEVSIEYHGVPLGVQDSTAPGGFEIGWSESEGEVYVVSQPNGAMNFMPCNDHPTDKAKFRCELTVPKPLMAVSCGRLSDTRENGELRTFVWEPRDLIATYLITICIAEFAVDEQESVAGIPITNYFAPRTTERQRKPFAATSNILQTLIDIAGPYPFESAGGVLAGMQIPGALECQTLPVYGRTAGSEDIIAHELAHQWFGNSVSVVDWSDIWLNEGFAEYLAWLYTERNIGREAFEEQVYRGYVTCRSVKNYDPPGAVRAESMFGLGVYYRGPLVLHALREEVGDELFFKILKDWAAEHRDGNVTIEGFIEFCNDHAQQDLEPLLTSWLRDPEMPHIAAFDARMAEEETAREQRRLEREARKAEREAKREKSEDPSDQR